MSWRVATPDDVAEILQLVRDLATYEREPDAVLATEEMLHAALFGENPSVFCHVIDHPESGDVAQADALGAGGAPEVLGANGSQDAQSARLAGFALWFLNFSTWLGRHGIYLEDLYVRPELRGRGYGRVLLQSLAQVCIERGYGRLEWWVLDWNSPAIDFYRSLDAEAMDEWTVFRLTGQSLKAMAAGDAPGGAPNPE
jgi:GNAT superfamily N-acetyltransferase